MDKQDTHPEKKPGEYPSKVVFESLLTVDCPLRLRQAIPSRLRPVFQNDANALDWLLDLIGQRFSISLKPRLKKNMPNKYLEIDLRTSNIINEFHGIEMEKKRKSFRVVFNLVPRLAVQN